MLGEHRCAPVPANEGARLAALRAYAILDTPVEGAFEDITRIAAHVCRAPIAVVNFIDTGRQWFKSEIGLGVRETVLEPSICAHAILQADLFVVEDTTADERFRHNPLVTGEPGLRFYAGAPLLTSDGLALGTVCVLDTVPRTLDADQRHALLALARQVMAQLELRRALDVSEGIRRFRSRLLTVLGHDLRAPLRKAGYSIAKARRGGVDVGSLLDEADASLAGITRELDQIVTLGAHEFLVGASTGQSCDVAQVVDALFETWRPLAERKGLSLVSTVPATVVGSHPALLATLVGNLLSNAVKYTAQGGVVVSLRREHDRPVLDVSDTGAGIEPARIARLFDAFQQGDPRGEGLGLGLWIVAQTAADLGHRVAVASRPGEGSTFSVIFER